MNNYSSKDGSLTLQHVVTIPLALCFRRVVLKPFNNAEIILQRMEPNARQAFHKDRNPILLFYNWQIRSSDISVESNAQRVCTIMSQLKDEVGNEGVELSEQKCRFHTVCETISKNMGNAYQQTSMKLEQVKESLQQCSDFLCKAQVSGKYINVKYT